MILRVRAPRVEAFDRRSIGVIENAEARYCGDLSSREGIIAFRSTREFLSVVAIFCEHALDGTWAST